MSSVFGTAAAQSIAGTNQVRRNETRERERVERARRGDAKRGDDIVVVHVEGAEAPRTVEGNDQEEAHEDRQQKAATYSPLGRAQTPPRKSIDVEG